MKNSAATSTGEVADYLTLYGDSLYRYAFMLTGQRELAEDLVQETLLIAHVKKDDFRGDGAVLAWLTKILKNKLIDLIRSRDFKETKLEAPEFFSEWGIWNDPFSKWFDWHESPEQSLERKSFYQAMSDCLAKLPLKQRMVIGLRAFEGLSTEAVCKELNISSSNEWVITYRARLGLRECLERNWFNKL